MTSALHIELTSPQSVDGKRAPYQSLWLLVRLCYAQRFEAASGVIRLAELRQQFTDARSLRMFISRAFKDFARWGVQVGWGEDAGGDPRFLNQDKRSQGPFWLPAAESERIACMVEGSPATQAELLGFLGMKRKSDTPAANVPIPMPADFWTVLATAQQNLRQGRLLAMFDERGNIASRPGNHAGALAAFKEASSLAGNRLQRALAALGEAQVWRRLDDLDAARKTLTQLRRVLKEGGADEGGYLDAMEQILTAWCAYSERDYALTEALLAAMRHAEPRAAVVRHHPRIRFEWHNLMALLKRTHALDAGASNELSQRRTAAIEAMRHFAAALDAAFEFGSFDAAQQVAANVGMATWLFACEGLAGDSTVSMRPEALRWLLLSESLCRCAGLTGQSAWNAIYLMRIARGSATRQCLPLAAFRSQQPLQPPEMLAQTGNIPVSDEDPLLPASWRALAEQLLERQRHGESRYSALQRCGLWLEHAWYAAHDGDLPAAAQSLGHLDDELPHLPASDKAFFDEARCCLPVELVGDKVTSLSCAKKRR